MNSQEQAENKQHTEKSTYWGAAQQKYLCEKFCSGYQYFKKEWKHVTKDEFELLTMKVSYPYIFI